VIKLFGARFECAKWLGYIWDHLVALVSSYFKLIRWVIEGRKYAAVGGD
jgi:hypothetical protein